MEYDENCIARKCELNGQQKYQTLECHSSNVEKLCRHFGKTLKLSNVLGLIGRLHDAGKASREFQNYILSGGKKGSVDHSTAGSMLLINSFSDRCERQMLSLPIMSHHSNLIDCIDKNLASPYLNRTQKSLPKLSRGFDISENERSLCEKEFLALFKRIKTKSIKNTLFLAGLVERFLHSSLVDADRQDAAAFENDLPINTNQNYYDWQVLISALESKLSCFLNDTKINKARHEISDICMQAAYSDTGIKKLAVPTGGGKTLAVMRFALSHCKRNKLDRIIYVLPFITIIEQNAQVIRELFSEYGINDIVLEHHSNVISEETADFAAENFDKQIIFTTSAQFLESFFGHGGTKSRRMHNFTNSCIVFDEVQAIPFNCIHLFNEALRFLTEVGSSTAVLCTATQPALDRIPSLLHRLNTLETDIVPKEKSFDCFSRVIAVDKTDRKLNYSEQATLIKEVMQLSQSCLMITNTKQNAYEVSRLLDGTFYLSTDLCPLHRKETLAKIKTRLDNKLPTVLISTSLIEAGVDISFETVIRHLAGLDSIVQAAGRCNRNSELINKKGTLIIIEPESENISKMKSIMRGKRASERILREYSDIFSEEAIESYFYYVYNENPSKNEAEMDYPLDNSPSLFELLSDNAARRIEYKQSSPENDKKITLPQSFNEANTLFHVIDDNTFGVICPYRNGLNLIDQIKSCKPFELKNLLREAQGYCVNRFLNEKQKLISSGIIYCINEDCKIYALNPAYYDDTYGFTKAVDNDKGIIF